MTVSPTTCNGSTVTDLTHDVFNRLAQVTKSGVTESYRYDDQGNPIQKNVVGTITNFVYNGPGVIGQYTSLWETGPNMDDPIIRATVTTTQYFYQDGLRVWGEVHR